jgi:hypothetical protein
MKSFIRQWVLNGCFVAVCLLNLSVSQATETNQVFTESWQHCFNQNELRGALNQTTFDHYLIVPENDQFKRGDVFVGFRLKSRPNDLWLSKFAGTEWTVYDGSADPEAYYLNSARLTPAMKITIFPQPTDLTAFSGDGELLVGYGLRNNATSTVKDSFEDMVNNRRYSVVWEIGSQLTANWSICLTPSQMRLWDGTVTIEPLPTGDGSDKVTLPSPQ